MSALPAARLRVTNNYSMNGGTANMYGLTAQNLSISGGTINVVTGRLTRDLIIAPQPGSSSPVEQNLSSGSITIDSNVHVGGDDSGPIGPAVLRSAAALYGSATASVIVHQQGVLAATDLRPFASMINRGTIRPNSDERGTLALSTPLTMTATSLYDVSIHAGLQADQITTTSAVAVDGLLRASFATPDATTALGQTLTLISGPDAGTFDNANSRLVVGDREFEIRYTPTSVSIVDVGLVPEPTLASTLALTLLARRSRRCVGV